MIPLVRSIVHAMLWDPMAVRRWLRGLAVSFSLGGVAFADQVAEVLGTPGAAKTVKVVALALAFVGASISVGQANAKPAGTLIPLEPPRPTGFARLPWLIVIAAVTGALIVGEAHAATAAPACKVRHDAHGFVRSQAVKLEFIRSSPQGACPATGKRALPCPGYEAHHIVWLSCGGEDRPENLVWLSTAQHDAVHAATVCRAKCQAGATP